MSLFLALLVGSPLVSMQPLAAVLVDLDATQFTEGALQRWTNNGTVSGVFVSTNANVPSVTRNAGTKGVTLSGNNFFTGPAAPTVVTGDGTRSIEAWVLNPTASAREIVVGWSRRGGPDGTNCGFGEGTDATLGAASLWGPGPDIGWGGNVVTGRWTYIVFTYDPMFPLVSVYRDGQLANSESTGPLNTYATDNTAAGNPLPFRVGTQSEANGNPTLPNNSGLQASMTIAKVRVHDVTLSPQDIASRYTQERGQFALGDSDNDGMPDYFELTYPAALNPNNAGDAGNDPDSDNLTNLEEFRATTDPTKTDTDGDGSDGAEVKRMVAGVSAPTSPVNPDSDADGLSDKAESGTGIFVSASDAGSDPLKTDTDDDTFSDLQEVMDASNPNIAASTPAPNRPPLIQLDATTLSSGPLNMWTNKGALAGVFLPPTNAVPNVESIQGIRGVTFDGTNHFFTGPAAPAFMAGNGSRTVEAWIYNVAVSAREAILAWGRRGGPDGTNCSFNDGEDAVLGAVNLWGPGPDIGWNGVLVTNRWSYVVFTYDAAALTVSVYRDGELANSEASGPLNTFAVDNTGAANRLPFRVGSQNEGNGTATATFRASFTLAVVRAHDQALSAERIAAQYNTEKVFFTATPPPSFKPVVLFAGTVTISWDGSGTLQEAGTLTGSVSDWSNVNPPPTGNSYATSLTGTQKYYRLAQ